MSNVNGAVVSATKAFTNPERFPLLLYKRILRLHYGLPKEMRIIGDQYVKDEFRRHKKVTNEQAVVFLKEWTEYCKVLSKQLSNSGIMKGKIGANLDPTLLEHLKEDQLLQLYNLKLEAEKPKTDIIKQSFPVSLENLSPDENLPPRPLI